MRYISGLFVARISSKPDDLALWRLHSAIAILDRLTLHQTDTLFREIPFALIQFPIYERLKKEWAAHQGKEDVSPLQAAACGSAGGAIAAAATCPLDVLKTRLMLGKDKKGKPYKNAIDVGRRILAEEGAGTLLSGIQPRVMWISIGGFVFFGSYEGFRSVLMPLHL